MSEKHLYVDKYSESFICETVDETAYLVDKNGIDVSKLILYRFVDNKYLPKTNLYAREYSYFHENFIPYTSDKEKRTKLNKEIEDLQARLKEVQRQIENL